MTDCVERAKLLSSAGVDLAVKLLPAPFKLQYSGYSGGCQATIVAVVPGKAPVPVWMGSFWYPSEFEDHGKGSGLFPDFAFAQPVIDKYFSDLAAAVEQRDAERQAAAERRHAAAEQEKREVIAAVRASLTTDGH